MPDKNWKFSANDAAERKLWDKYMEAYEDMIRNTATEESPWYVVPADNKWFTRVAVAAAIVETCRCGRSCRAGDLLRRARHLGP